MVFHCGLLLYVYFCIFILKMGPTGSLTSSTTEYIYPNKCNNMTCNYESPIAIDRNTVYTVRNANDSTLFEKNIYQKKSPYQCLLNSNQPCNDERMCWCDPNGLSTRICYNHTSGGEGQLTLRCISSDGHHQEKLSTIAEIPSNVHPNNVTYNVSEGQSFGPLECNATCGPPCTFRWNGPASIINSNQLFLINVARQDNGTYQCKATNTIGTAHAHVVLIVKYGPNQVILSPNETSLTFDEGDYVPDVTCDADCQPDCFLMWITPTGQVESNGILRLQKINRTQAGTYMCNASNDIGNMVSDGVTINVRYGAEIKDITINGGNFTIPEKVKTQLTCKIDGDPMPNGSLIFNEEEQLRTGNPIVYAMVPLCNDTGNYTCAADNSIGKSNQTKELFVMCSPRPVDCLQSKIAVGNDSILQINVIFFSYPQPKISWTFSKNGSNEIVSSNDTIGIYQHISSIYITNMKTSQYGMYVLQVINGIPDDLKHVFEVLPQRQPDIPTNFSASCDAPDYANLKWIPSFHGGDTQQFKLYYAVQDRPNVLIKHRTDIKGNENELFNFERVDGLLPATSYVFKLIAYNTFGDSNFVESYCNTTKTALEEESNIGLYIGASIGTFAAVFSIGLSIVVLFLRRKKYQGKQSERNERMALADESEYADEGLKDNILYETAGSDLGQGTTKVGYEVNDKKKHNKHGTDNSAFQETALCGVVQKKTGQDEVSIKENKTKKDNDKGKKNNKNEDIQDPSHKESSKQNLNKDGLKYADLVFSKSTTGPKFVIRGVENRTIYAVVDTTQKRDPLPESDEEEPSDKNTSIANNEESGI